MMTNEKEDLIVVSQLPENKTLAIAGNTVLPARDTFQF